MYLFWIYQHFFAVHFSAVAWWPAWLRPWVLSGALEELTFASLRGVLQAVEWETKKRSVSYGPHNLQCGLMRQERTKDGRCRPTGALNTKACLCTR